LKFNENDNENQNQNDNENKNENQNKNQNDNENENQNENENLLDPCFLMSLMAYLRNRQKKLSIINYQFSTINYPGLRVAKRRLIAPKQI
jgi:hypothetical protein